MKAILLSTAGVIEMEIEGIPPSGIKHEGRAYRLLAYDDPNWDGSFATYAEAGLSDSDARERERSWAAMRGTNLGQNRR